MGQFPYVLASWRVRETQEVPNDNDADFNVYINQFKNNFDDLCVHALN